MLFGSRTGRTVPAALLCWLLAPLLAGGCRAEDTAVAPVVGELPEDAGKTWVRLLKEEDQVDPLSLQTAIIRYVPRADFVPGQPAGEYGRFVDLIAAVHVADQQYYDALNDRFRGYDAVLYELVAAQGTVVPKGRGTSNSHPLGALQNGMKSLLELEHQLEQIDYTVGNFVHADLSPDEFMQAMADRDDNFLKMALRMFAASMAHELDDASASESPELEMALAFAFEDRARRLKVALAKQFESMESMMAGFAGAEGSTIITDRNTRALEVLREQLDAGVDQLAVFYGAAHLSDMHQRLVDEFRMQPVALEWVDAWNLSKQ